MDRKLHTDKTRQDQLPNDQRDRVKNWNRILNFSQKHKPACGRDWLKLRNHGG